MQKATIEFFWLGAPQNAASVHESADRVYYTGFNLNGVTFQAGEYVLLHPEEEASLHYVGKLVKCFHDKSGAYGDPHCVEVRALGWAAGSSWLGAPVARPAERARSCAILYVSPHSRTGPPASACALLRFTRSTLH